MKLSELVKKLTDKPHQDREVDFLVYNKSNRDIVCIDLGGKETLAIMDILSKRKIPSENK